MEFYITVMIELEEGIVMDNTEVINMVSRLVESDDRVMCTSAHAPDLEEC